VRGLLEIGDQLGGRADRVAPASSRGRGGGQPDPLRLLDEAEAELRATPAGNPGYITNRPIRL
jgi:hypothetical protein